VSDGKRKKEKRGKGGEHDAPFRRILCDFRVSGRSRTGLGHGRKRGEERGKGEKKASLYGSSVWGDPGVIACHWVHVRVRSKGGGKRGERKKS